MLGRQNDFGIQARCESKPEWKLYSWAEIRLLNSTDIVASSTKNRRRGQLTTVYGIRTYIDSLYERNTGKKARYIKGTQKFVSQRVISYKISTKICAIYLYMHKNTVSVTNNTIWWPKKKNSKRKFTDNRNQENQYKKDVENKQYKKKRRK